MADDARARRHWDRQAPTYNQASAWLERRALADGRSWACVRATGTVLDLGIGTGHNLPHLPADIALTGLDRSPAMLDQARERAEGLGRPVELVEGDAGALPFPDGHFDTVVCTYVLCCVPDERLALTEALRVLRPGGHLLLADHIGSSNGGVRVAQRLVESVSGPLNGERFTRRPLTVLRTLPGVEVAESRRTTLGLLEQVDARRLG